MGGTNHDRAPSALATGDATPHQRYRSRLGAVVADEFIDTLTARRLLPAGAGRWTRTFGRFLPDEPVWALTVLGAGDRQVVVEVLDDDAADIHAQLPGVGGVRVRELAADAALPGLAPLMGSGEWRPVRYRPGSRCVLRSLDGARFAKVFGDDRGRQVHTDGIALRALEERGGLPVRVAEPGTFDPDTRVLVQATVPGAAARDSLRTVDAVAMATRMGEAVGALALVDVEPVRVTGAEVHDDRLRRYADDVRRRLPHLADDIDGFVADAVPLAGLAAPRLRPVHGAPHAEQWLDDGHRLGLVDLDGFAFGLVEMDVATWIGEIDFERRLGAPTDALVAAFIGGVRRHVPIDGFLVEVYRAYKQFAKVRRTAQALRLDGDEAAARHLQRARRTLDAVRAVSAPAP